MDKCENKYDESKKEEKNIISRMNSEDGSTCSSISSNVDYEKYIFRAKLCSRLSKEFNLDEIPYNMNDIDYDAPKDTGLHNSNVIIQSYYLHRENNILPDINYLNIIKDDIRNIRVLNTYQMEYIKNLSHNEKNELFDIYNACVKCVSEII